MLAIDLAPRSILGSVMGAFNVVGGGIGVIVFLETGGVLFDAVGPYAPFVFTGLGNVVIVCYALWVMMGAAGLRNSRHEPLTAVKRRKMECEGGRMPWIIVGLLAMALGLWGGAVWWWSVVDLLRGLVPIVLVIVGLLALAVGVTAVRTPERSKDDDLLGDEG